MSSNTPSPKYPQPRILLMDLQKETEAVLVAAGYNVSLGSFGTPYKVPQSDNILPVIINGKLPENCSEQEIVVIDLVSARCLEQLQGEKHISEGENDWWASCSRGMIDPRPRLMAACQEDFDRILFHGGVFIIFAAARYLQKISWGHITYYLRQREFRKINDITFDNWCFLSILNANNLETKFVRGQEISVAVEKFALNQLLSQHIKETRFLCTLNPKGFGNSWYTLAENIYGEPIAGTIVLRDTGGCVFIFPQLEDKPHFLAQFFDNVLPDLAPHLFPDAEGFRWVQQPEYELPKVLKLKNQIQQLQEEAKKQVAALEESIEKERAEMAFLHDLIRETGSSLVNAVKNTLKVLGFQSVIDLDEEIEKARSEERKSEDLQIHDNSPILLVEVKGISGRIPTDADVLEVQKYVIVRLREWKPKDVQGLAIINHERHRPPLERENKELFRKELLINAQEQKLGLLTTWDLYRLMQSYHKNGWKHEHIKALFYQSGRIEPVPTHYKFIGTVEHYYPRPKAVTIWIEAEELRLGDRIAFELPVEFEEQDVKSLEVDNQPVKKVVAQAANKILAGIKTNLTHEQLKKGVRVYRVIETTTI